MRLVNSRDERKSQLFCFLPLQGFKSFSGFESPSLTLKYSDWCNHPGGRGKTMASQKTWLSSYVCSFIHSFIHRFVEYFCAVNCSRHWKLMSLSTRILKYLCRVGKILEKWIISYRRVWWPSEQTLVNLWLSEKNRSFFMLLPPFGIPFLQRAGVFLLHLFYVPSQASPLVETFPDASAPPWEQTTVNSAQPGVTIICEILLRILLPLPGSKHLEG